MSNLTISHVAASIVCRQARVHFVDVQESLGEESTHLALFLDPVTNSTLATKLSCLNRNGKVK